MVKPTLLKVVQNLLQHFPYSGIKAFAIHIPKNK